MFLAQQRSAFSRFVYDFFDPAGIQVGTLKWPDVAVASNARLKGLVPGFMNTRIEISHNGKRYDIAFEYLTRGWVSTIRFSLQDGDTTLASAVVGKTGKRLERPTIRVTQPFQGQVIRKSTLFTTRYEVTRDGEDGKNGAMAGTIASEARLMLKRELQIDLPASVSAPVQFFLFFLVCNQAYR